MNGGLYRGNNTTSEKNERQTFTNKFSHVCECCFIRFFYFFELLFLGALLFSSFIVQFFICAPPAWVLGCWKRRKTYPTFLIFAHVWHETSTICLAPVPHISTAAAAAWKSVYLIGPIHRWAIYYTSMLKLRNRGKLMMQVLQRTESLHCSYLANLSRFLLSFLWAPHTKFT